MKNPCGTYVGMKHPLSKDSGGKLTQVLGKRGEPKKYIIGGK